MITSEMLDSMKRMCTGINAARKNFVRPHKYIISYQLCTTISLSFSLFVFILFIIYSTICAKYSFSQPQSTQTPIHIVKQRRLQTRLTSEICCCQRGPKQLKNWNIKSHDFQLKWGPLMVINHMIRVVQKSFYWSGPLFISPYIKYMWLFWAFYQRLIIGYIGMFDVLRFFMRGKFTR